MPSPAGGAEPFLTQLEIKTLLKRLKSCFGLHIPNSIKNARLPNTVIFLHCRYPKSNLNHLPGHQSILVSIHVLTLIFTSFIDFHFKREYFQKCYSVCKLSALPRKDCSKSTTSRKLHSDVQTFCKYSGHLRTYQNFDSIHSKALIEVVRC